MRTRNFNIPDISCGHCESVIKKALHSLPGLGPVEVDIPNRRIKVAFDETAFDVRILGGILEGVGYPIESEIVRPSVNKGGASCCGSCSN